LSAIGVYQPGMSVVHRAPAGLKLLLLVLVGAATFMVGNLHTLGAALLAVLLLYALAGLGPRVVWRQLRPLVWLVVAFGVFHALLNGWLAALLVVGTILVLVLLAGLVSTTTRTTALVDSIVGALRPLRRVGVDPERIGLLLALSVRAVPVVAGLAGEVRDAQRARGVRADVRTFGAPFLIRSLRHADALSEALRARGVDD
jgi:biotin transport system permease protein